MTNNHDHNGYSDPCGRSRTWVVQWVVLIAFVAAGLVLVLIGGTGSPPNDGDTTVRFPSSITGYQHGR